MQEPLNTAEKWFSSAALNLEARLYLLEGKGEDDLSVFRMEIYPLPHDKEFHLALYKVALEAIHTFLKEKGYVSAEEELKTLTESAYGREL